MYSLHYDSACPSTTVKCTTKELHEITAILIQSNYSVLQFVDIFSSLKPGLHAFKVWAG